MGGQGREQDDAAATAEDWQQLLDEEERRAEIGLTKSLSKSSTVVLLDCRRFRDSGIGDKDVRRSPITARTCLASLCGPSGSAKVGSTASARPPSLWISATTAFGLFHALLEWTRTCAACTTRASAAGTTYSA